MNEICAPFTSFVYWICFIFIGVPTLLYTILGAYQYITNKKTIWVPFFKEAPLSHVLFLNTLACFIILSCLVIITSKPTLQYECGAIHTPIFLLPLIIYFFACWSNFALAYWSASAEVIDPPKRKPMKKPHPPKPIVFIRPTLPKPKQDPPPTEPGTMRIFLDKGQTSSYTRLINK